MSDSKITKKHHPSGSLARRILTVAILLLVIPLFLQSLFLYHQEYSQKLEDVEADLKILASERAHFIEEAIQMNWELLENSERIGGGTIQRIPLPRNVPEHFVLVSKSQNALLAGIAESDTSALIVPIPFTLIAKDMPRTYSIRICFLDSQKKILWENSKQKKGEWIEAEEPIGNTGLSIQLSVEKDQIHGLHFESYIFRFASLLFFVGIIGGGAVFLFTRRIARPLRALSKTMQRVSDGASHARYTPDAMGFEINAIGIQFNETLDGLLRHAQEAANERLHRERLAKELSIGHEIQASLLPSHVPGLPGVDIAASYLASREVNGDFYDLYHLASGQLLIAICDTAGKGISACLFALGLRSIIRSLASMVTDLSELVRRTNDLYLIDAHETSMFSTLWIGIYDPAAKKMTYCSQGHPPALLIRGIQLEELWTAGIALGAQKVDVIQTQEIALGKGDFLVLYTDGIIEAHNPDRQLFGKERFYELLLKKQKTTAQQIVTRVIEEVQLFARGAPQHDDMTLLIVHISD